MRLYKFIFVFFVILFTIFCANLNSAKADGGIFYPPSYYMNETGQKALIYYQDQTENLVVSTSFNGNSKDFAWVIPTPSKPEVFKSSNSLFTTLEKITNTADNIQPVESTLSTFGSSDSKSSVQVIEEKTIDIYDTAVLKATDDQALAQWLADHGYSFPKEKSYMLQDYINNGWYFVIAKIQNAFTENSEIKDQLSSGTITPLRLKFQTSKIIYPMKLTRLALDYAQTNASGTISGSYSPAMQINLYVLTDSKTTQNNLKTNWANWINSKDISNLNSSITEENWITKNKLFLTKMSSNVNIKDVENDFLITKATDNSIYPKPIYKTFSFWLINFLALLLTIVIGVLSPIGLLFIISLILQIFISKKRWLYILGNIYQVCACTTILIVLATYLIVMSETAASFWKIFLEESLIGISVGLLVLLTAAIFFTVKMIKKYKKVYSADQNL